MSESNDRHHSPYQAARRKRQRNEPSALTIKFQNDLSVTLHRQRNGSFACLGCKREFEDSGECFSHIRWECGDYQKYRFQQYATARELRRARRGENPLFRSVPIQERHTQPPRPSRKIQGSTVHQESTNQDRSSERRVSRAPPCQKARRQGGHPQTLGEKVTNAVPILETKEEHAHRVSMFGSGATPIPKITMVAPETEPRPGTSDLGERQQILDSDTRGRSSLFLPSPNPDFNTSGSLAGMSSSTFICPPFVPIHSAAAPSTPLRQNTVTMPLSTSQSFGTAPLLSASFPVANAPPQTAPEDPVLVFLQRLARPLPQHYDLFKSLGVISDAWLDRLEFHWADFCDALLKQNVTFIECCEIKAGLQRRNQLRAPQAAGAGAQNALATSVLVKREPVA